MQSAASTWPRSSDRQRAARRGAGRNTLAVVAAAFTLVTLPVVARGGPLRDDFDLCTSPRWNSGLGRAVAEILPESGAVRLPGRLAQVFVISTGCDMLPFWALILIPLTLTLTVAFLLLRLLDGIVPPPWPHLAAALWLLQPLGTESALWATQFNIPFALALALLALLLFRDGRHLGGAAAALAAYGFVEQVIFGLPVAAWLVAPARERQRALAWSGGLALVVLAIYARWPGYSDRTAVGAADRLLAPFRDLGWYVEYPAVTLGLHSIPVAVLWAFPLSVALIGGAAVLGARGGPRLLQQVVDPLIAASPIRSRDKAAAFLLLLLVNTPMLTIVPHPDSPRTFTPTWLVVSALAAVAGSRMRWRRPQLAGGTAGILAAGALLSLALSVGVRVRTADFTEASSLWLAEHVSDGGAVLICDVPRTAVTPAPAGDFAVHELIHPWSAQAAIRYYTGDEIAIQRAWSGPCSDPDVDLTVSFDDLPDTLGGD